MIRVCSGFSPTGRVQYGERFLSTFDRFWPKDIDLQVYVEKPFPMPRDACRDLWAIPGAKDFHMRHKRNLEAHGRKYRKGWKEKDRRKGYCFKFDAYKFWKQILIPQAAAEGMDDGEILIWLDGDVETIAPVSQLNVVDWLGEADLAYLNREPQHSEIGFWAVRIGPTVREFLADMAQTYTTDAVFDLDEWHSAFVWDHSRRKFDMTERHLCRKGRRGHVWPSTPLAPYMRHDKGMRKPR